jgi:pimeloyl-ACP methyl ester carboxylesterase
VIGSPHFFGPPNRSRFSMVHWPSGRLVGSALICPPVAYEAVCAHQSLRRLAEQLAERGIATMRLDYDGTGNSIGDPRETGRVEAWIESIADGIGELTRLARTKPVVVGVRLGGTLALEAAGTGSGVAGAVLWDPVIDGRRYMRSLKLLGSSVDPDLHGGVETVVGGIPFTRETLGSLSRLRLEVRGVQVPGLLVVRAELDGNETELPAGWTEQRLPGTERMLDTDAELAEVPQAILDVITDWTVRHVAEPAVDVDLPSLEPTAVEVTDGLRLIHRARRIGPNGILAFETSRDGSDGRVGVLMLNNGVAPVVGPGRSWIELARRCAIEGHRAVRLDLSGLGESPPWPGYPEQDSYPAHAGSDIVTAVELMKTSGTKKITTVGLCSGALLSFDGALRSPEIDTIISINGRFDRPFHDRRRDRPERAARSTARVAAIPLHKAPLVPVFERLPAWFWSLCDRLHIVALPTHAITRFVKRRPSRLVLVFGPNELGLRTLRHRAGQEFDALLNTAAVTLVEVDALDHSMFDLDAREVVFAKVMSQLDSE